MPGRLRDPRLTSTSSGLGPRTPNSARPYEDWTVAELRRQAAELGIRGRTALRKDALIAALRALSTARRTSEAEPVRDRFERLT